MSLDPASSSNHPAASPRSILVVGLTGGIGCGKSAVAEMIRAQHPVLDSDAIARELLSERHELQRAIREAFGTTVFTADGLLDREALAGIVFNNESAVQRLNSIVHPAVVHEIDQRIDALNDAGKPVVFVESALIFEAHLEDMFDYIIAVVASEETVLARMEAAGTLRIEDVRRRIARQLPVEDKAARADFVIRNDGSRDELERGVTLILSLVPALCRIPVS